LGQTLTEASAGGAIIRLVQGDLTEQQVDAIVNAANSSLMGGGGVDGAIHRAGGPEILAECKVIVQRQGRLPAGEAVATTAGRLPARRVIHTVGPVWHGGGTGEPDTLARAYRSGLSIAREEGLRTVAFPSISTGAYRYPLDGAARIAVRVVKEELERQAGSITEVRFVLFSAAALQGYAEALAEVFGMS
jgi:O-acetyl-ADP-ribose deacetylase (regulator of RNase III)